jgi:hypothetical protein
MKLKFIAVTLLYCLLIQTSAEAQVKKRKPTKEKENTEEVVPFLEKLSGDIRIGNIGINQGFSLSVKPGVGYNFSKLLTAGIGSKVFVDYSNFRGQEVTYVDYGGFAFARLKIQSFYIQGEYAITKYEYPNLTINYPLAGVGYLSGYGSKWRYGAELMIPLSADARKYGVPLEYWLNFAYNF